MASTSSTKDRLVRAALLERVKQRRGAPAPSPTAAPPIAPADRDLPLAASWSQERLWFLDRLDPAAGRAYHIPAGLRLRGALDRAALRRTLDRVVARHESLRTTFHAGDHGRPVQRIGPADQGFRLSEYDLRGLAGDEQRLRLDDLIAREAAAPFDLAAGPLIRGRLIQLSADEHVLLITQHHIISDGWSIGVLVKEVSALYAAFCEGRPDPLPAPRLQYADYAAWQRAWLAGAALDAEVQFWRDHLRDTPAVLELPSDRPRPPIQSHRGAAVPLVLPPALTAALRAFSRAHGATPFMTLLAAWSVLMTRLSGQSEVVVGTPVAGRTRPELESMIGLFVNTLALRVTSDGDPTVAELVERVRSTALDAYAHQDLAFDRVVEAVRPQRSLGHGPLFQTVLALNNTPPLELHLPGLDLVAFEVPQTTTQHDLALLLTESEHAITGHIGYARDLFDHATIERLAEQLVRVLQGMLASAAEHVSRLPLLGDAERHRILVSFNATDRELPDDALIHRWFERQVRRQPDATAVVASEHSLTYDALNRRANQLARCLRRLGVRAEHRVAIHADRGVDMIVSMLAALKAGACYVPLDPAQPAARLAHMLRDCAPAALLTQRAPGEALAGHGAPVIALDAPPALSAFAGESEDDLDPDGREPSSRALAYVMYTSGSTGLPKGVMVEHRSVLRLVVHGDYATVGVGDAVAHCANPAFDAATWEVWSALLNGARVVAIADATVLEPQAFGRALAESGVTAMWLTVGLFNAYVDALGPVFGRLDHLLVGGDALDPARIADLIERGHAPRHLINGYGPTEGTTFTTTQEIGPVVSRTRAIPIGRPIANTRVYILDAHGQPVPIGVTGEIYIGGAGVARGYLNQPELTAERFVRDRFVPAPDARLYRSGDRGRWLPDGTIEFLGRNDFQVKLRGFRVELGEIEAQLRANPAVREAVVVALGDLPGDKRLVAYVRMDDGARFDAAAERDRLGTALPGYMIPSAFVVVDRFPLTANGKLDRRALPAPDARSAAAREYVEPEGEIERSVAAIWRSLLGVKHPGRLDSFFELGGHSLLAVQLVSRLRGTLGVEIPLREVFARPTLADLAAAIERTALASTASIPRVDRDRPLEVSWSQQRLWFLDQLDPAASLAYHIAAVIEVRGPLDGAALRRALDRVVARHESLRTSFERGADGRPLQRIAPADHGFHLIEHDLRGRPAPDQQRELHALIAREARAPFDLAAGPLIRGRLVRLADDAHVLLVTQHHIISDGWSNGILIRELAALFDAFSQGHPDPLPEPPIQYADYAAWQRAWLSGPALAAQVAFWRHHLRGAPALLELPTDHPRPPVASYRGASVAVEIAPALAARLRAFSHRHGATLFMALLAGWSSLLSRLSGQTEVVTGTPVANRQRAEVETVIGCFVNTLALRVSVSDDPTVAELIARVRETTVAAYAHQDLPFEQIVDALQPPRSLSHNPVFQTMLALDNTPAPQIRLPGLELSLSDAPHTTAQCDLMFSLAERVDAIEGRLDYATDLWTAATIERMAEQFQTLLEGMVDDDARRVSRLPLLGAAQRHRVIATFNDTAQDYPARLLHQLFEDRVREQPDAIAVVCEDELVSYDALNRRANRLAHHLIGLGVRPDDRVAICAERSAAMVVGLLGTLKAGASYVPLDPAYPAERLAHMLRDSAPIALLTQRALRDRLPAHDLPTLALDAEGTIAVLAGQPERDPDPAALGLAAHHLAYVMYTSGSTGLPKGVMVPHGAVVNRILWGQQDYPLTAADRVIQKTPFSFDPSLFELFWTFVAGARLIMARPGAHQDVDYLVDAIERYQLTMIHFVSSMLSLFIDQAKRRSLRSLRRVVIGGESLPYAVQQRFHDLLPGVELLNLYGPTETAIEVTHWLCVPDRYPGIVPIGYPIANTQIYIVDEHMQPVPIGVAGEIYIGGAQVSRGYLHQPELTAERFVADPFVPGTGRKLYRTGDLGRWLPDGAIEFLGRRDSQVKIRGLRLELGEIETRLAACAAIRQAVVIAREDRPGDKRLVGYYVADDGTEPTAAALRAELAQFLTDPMIPSAFVQLPALPLTPNGKLDRRLLPEPDQASVATRAYVAPEGNTEAAVAAVWQELLGLDRIGRDDQFFELGGHSLLAVQAVSRLRQVLGTEIALRDLFTYPTVAAFAEAVGGAPRAALPPITPADRGGPLPLSWAQQRLWFLDQLDHAVSAAYHMSEGLRLRGRLDRAALQATFDRIVARHEVLRTTFVSTGGTPIQVIAPPDVGFHIVDEDLRGMTDDAREAAVRRRSAAAAAEPFDLTRGPLVRVNLLRLADDDHLLLITKHHIISDGWSVGLFIQEVIALYTAFTQGKPEPLAPPALQYADYAIWQQQWLRGEVLDQQVRFWKDYLAGAPPLIQLPTDHPRPEIQRHVGRRLPFAIAPDTARGIHALSRKHGTTPFMTLLAGWSALLSRLTGQSDLVVGTPVANRQRAELEPVMGFFANVLALRIDLDGDPTVAELLARAKASTVAAYAHQDLPFEQVVDALQPPRSLSHNPLFQVNITLENVPTERAIALPGLEVEIVELPHTTTQFDLALHLLERDGAFEGRFYYSSDLFDEGTIERLGEQLHVVLRAMLDDDRQRVSRLPLLTDAQRHRILSSFNATRCELPADPLLHRLFEDQVRRRPEAAAVVCEDRSLSYRELNRRANRLAHHLIGLGVRADDRVALVLERGVDLMVGVLGILKAGAGYLPLDPTHPAERLAQIAGDAAPAAVVTQRALRDAWPATGIPVVLVDALDDALDASDQRVDDPDPAALGVTPRHLAYVIYTSGSTGTPKGVMVEHRNAVNLWAGLETTAFAGAPVARVGLNAAMTFDASVQAVVQLLSGRTVVIVPHAARLDGTAFVAYLRAHQVDAFDCTPSQLGFLLDAELLAGDAAPRAVLVGGEAISADLWRRMRAAPATRFYNVYGPTECTVDATLGDLHELGERPSIGRPLPNTQVYVLDAQLQPVPVGVTGEIYIGGAGVARGYLDRSELTAERFVEDRFSSEPGRRMYRTGDLARWLADGTLEYLGRNDFQIKLRGYRIELGEIESHLRASPLVHDAVVIVREDRPGDKRLVAYVVPGAGASADAATLRTHLLARLPDYMVPAAFVALDRLPTTSSGKLDRAALPAPDAGAMATREYAAPVGDTEVAIAAIWQSLLELERVGRHDNFFELGGYSLTAIQVVARLREQFGVSLPLTRLFQATTIAELAEAVMEARLAGYATADVERLSSEVDDLSEAELMALLSAAD